MWTAPPLGLPELPSCYGRQRRTIVRTAQEELKINISPTDSAKEALTKPLFCGKVTDGRGIGGVGARRGQSLPHCARR